MAERAGRKAARNLVSRSGYRIGGHLGRAFANGGAADDAEDKEYVRKGVGQHEGAMHKGEPKTRLRFQDGGNTFGATVPQRGDRGGRGRSNVNIFVSGGGPPQIQTAGGPPGGMPPRPPPGPPPGGPPPGGPPPGAPPGAGAMPPGMPPRGPMGMPTGMPGAPGGPGPGPMMGGIGPGGGPMRPPGMARGGRARGEDPEECGEGGPVRRQSGGSTG